MINTLLIIFFSVACCFAFYNTYVEEKKALKKKKKTYTQKSGESAACGKVRSFIDEYYNVLLVLVFVIGILVRAVLFWQYPLGINQDEASAVYDAFADLKYGVDRNGYHNAVYLVAWGSGQNALYTIFTKPFIALFGLNMFSARIVNVLFGCIALFAFYGILKRLLSRNAALFGTFFFAICPWHIMMTRWALESNLFPNMFLLATYFLIRGFDNQRYYIPSIIVYALSLYAYGAAYMTVPVFMLFMAIYLYKYKKITLKNLIICTASFVIIAMPLILFMVVNVFSLPEIDLGFMSIPRLTEGRYSSTVTALSGDFFKAAMANLKTFFKIIFTQDDGLIWNAVLPYGIIFLFSIPFMLTGFICVIIDAIKKRKTFNPTIIVIAMIVSMFVLVILSDVNINRANFAMIVIIMLTVYGACFMLKNVKNILIPTVLIYAIAFGMFTGHYFTDYQDQIGWSFSHGFGDAIKYADKEVDGKIYMTNKINAPYIKAMFYLETNPRVFINTVDYYDDNAAFRYVNSFSRYYTGIPSRLPKGDNAYIFTNGEYAQRTDFNKADYETMVFGHYTVAIEK